MTIDGRPLTQGEINMLTPIFGDSINYDAVEITSNSILIDGAALSIGGDVRFDPIDYQTDFSQTSTQDQSWFVHEMTHVWQSQNGFEALKAEDTNKDGKFDVNDTNFSNVRVWRDMDGDVLLFVA